MSTLLNALANVKHSLRLRVKWPAGHTPRQRPLATTLLNTSLSRSRKAMRAGSCTLSERNPWSVWGRTILAYKLGWTERPGCTTEDDPGAESGSGKRDRSGSGKRDRGAENGTGPIVREGADRSDCSGGGQGQGDLRATNPAIQPVPDADRDTRIKT